MLQREDFESHSRLVMEHGKANVLDTEFLRALAAALEEIERDEVPALILTGRGRIFSAGVALDRVVAGGADYLKEFLPALDDCLERIFSFRHPLVAAINGHAIAGGAILACAADHRLLARGAGMGVPELRVGVPFPAAAIEILRFALAPGHLVEVVQGGETYRDEEALRRGLADELVDAETLEARAQEVALDLASIPATSFELTKAGLRSAASRAMAEEEVRTGADIRRAWASEPVLAAIAAYVERVLGK
jgi:enoyl-CoA hydratase/carnithine racemase